MRGILHFVFFCMFLHVEFSFAQDQIESLLEVSPYEEFEQFRSTANIDQVSKILNDIEGLSEESDRNSFWYAVDSKNCNFKKASVVEVKSSNVNSFDFLKSFIKPSSKVVFDPSYKEVRMNEWTLQSLRVGYVDNRSEWWGPDNRYVQVIANGALMFESSKPRNMDRVQAEIGLIFRKYCTGIDINHF